MSLITRCPACGTMFKIVPDQLRISDGWVRCGQCAVVFEAPEHLQQDPVIAEPAPPAAVRVDPVLNHDADADAEADLKPVDIDFLLSEFPPEIEPDAVTHPAQRDAVALPARSNDPMDFQLDEPAHASASEFLMEPSPMPSLAPSSASEPTLQEVSFVRQIRREARWQRPLARRLLVAVCALLVLLLGLQWVMHGRDRIAAFAPQTRSWLQSLCVPLRCTVAPLRQIESIVVDGSSFRKIRDNVYQLNLTIRNAAPVALATPSVDLALTDTQDQPVLRRVLSPADLGAAPVLPAGAEWSGSIPVSVTDGAIASRVAGYRVLAFYP